MKYSITLFLLLMLIVSCSEDTPSSEQESKDSEQNSTQSSGLVEYVWKDEEKQEAMDNCLNSGNETEFCSCSVEILTSLFTYEEFYDFDKQIRDKKQPSPEMASRMIEMSKRVYSSCK